MLSCWHAMGRMLLMVRMISVHGCGYEVYFCHQLVAEVDLVQPVDIDRSHGHALATQRPGHAQVMTLEADPALGLHLADPIVRAVLDRRQLLRIGARTGPIALRWHRHAQRLVWPLAV